jgi:hypothetical protein
MEKILAQKCVIEELKLELLQKVALLSRVPALFWLVFTTACLPLFQLTLFAQWPFPNDLVFASFEGVEKNKENSGHDLREKDIRF